MDDELKSIKARSFISALSLFLQSGYASLLGFVANLVLTILLSPAIFGIYVTVLSLISLLNYFSDIGLAASLIQKKDLTDDDIKTVFTTQQILIITLITLGFFLTPFIVSFYKLPPEGSYLYWAFLFSFFISSLKTIPSALLERNIYFKKIAFVQILEHTVFNVSVMVLAGMGYGLQSFTFAVVARAIVGLIAIYTVSFWKPAIGISVASLKNILAFGVPFQASSFLALFKDDLIILFLAKIVGFEILGYIGWAKKYAEAPLRIVMDNINRIMFPLLSRFQHDKAGIAQIMEKNLFYQTAIVAPSILGIALIMSSFVQLIPNYQKWYAALPIFYIFCFSSFIVSFASPFINLFNALGKVKITFSFMMLWTVLTWLMTPLFVQHLGMYGFPIAHLIVSLTSLLAVIKAKQLIPLKLTETFYQSLVSTVSMGLVVYLLLKYLPITNVVLLLIPVSIGATVYFMMMKYLFNIDFIREGYSLLKQRG